MNYGWWQRFKKKHFEVWKDNSAFQIKVARYLLLILTTMGIIMFEDHLPMLMMFIYRGIQHVL